MCPFLGGGLVEGVDWGRGGGRSTVNRPSDMVPTNLERRIAGRDIFGAGGCGRWFGLRGMAGFPWTGLENDWEGG